MERFTAFRKARRMTILKIVFVLIFAGFFCAYQGGISGNPILITASFVIFSLAVLGILVVKQ